MNNKDEIDKEVDRFGDVSGYVGSRYAVQAAKDGQSTNIKKPKNPDVLERAIKKQAEGRGTSNTEKKAINDYAQGKIGVDHFSNIKTTPVRIPSSLPSKDDGATGKKSVGIEDVDGLQSALRVSSNNLSDISDLTARIVVLETLLSGLARRTVDVCDAGTAKTMTIVSTTPA